MRGSHKAHNSASRSTDAAGPMVYAEASGAAASAECETVCPTERRRRCCPSQEKTAAPVEKPAAVPTTQNP